MLNPVVFPSVEELGGSVAQPPTTVLKAGSSSPVAPAVSRNAGTLSSTTTPMAFVGPLSGAARLQANSSSANQSALDVGEHRRAQCHFKVVNVSFLGLISNQTLLYDFEVAVKRALAGVAGDGVVPQDVSVKLSAGSVVADASVFPSDGSSPSALRRRLNESASVQDVVLSRLLAIPGLEFVSLGKVAITQFSAPLLEADRQDVSGVSPFFTGVLVLLLVLLLAGPLAIVCMARRIGDEKTHKVTRGLTLDGGHSEMLVVLSATPRSIQPSPRSTLRSSSAASSEQASSARTFSSMFSKACGYQLVPMGEFAASPAPTPEHAGEFDLVTVKEGGLCIQPYSGLSPPGMKVVVPTSSPSSERW